jgi:hypothetical protein
MYGPCMGKNGGSLNGSLSKALFRLRLRSFHPAGLVALFIHSMMMIYLFIRFDDDDSIDSSFFLILSFD